MPKVVVRDYFSDRIDEGIACEETEMAAKQAFKDDCDVNHIMRKYRKTGLLPQMIRKDPTYGDFSNPLDFQAAENLIIKAREQFEALPAAVRTRFQNDPVQFLDFCSKEENREEMSDMGLLKPEVKEKIDNARDERASERVAAKKAKVEAPKEGAKAP